MRTDKTTAAMAWSRQGMALTTVAAERWKQAMQADANCSKHTCQTVKVALPNGLPKCSGM